MVSLPSYDPNLFVNGISSADYRALMDNPSRPLFNRNVLGGGPPGSTIKPFMALAGLESGLRRPEDRVFSTGEFHIPGQQRGYRDAHGGGGWVDLHKSIAASVNSYYYRSEEHTSELQSLMRISYAVFCLKNTKTNIHT